MQAIFLLKQSNQLLHIAGLNSFEALRMRTENYKQRMKDNVKVFLANMGQFLNTNLRADFSTGFFEVGAFEVIKKCGHETTADAAKAARESGADVVVICSTDDTYPRISTATSERVERNYAECNSYLGRGAA